ncbi:helix-turn-helix domain-containing protein [Faecalibaculum rodentium]|uniref:helix-turn-helix domain-containing protein n=1 Tax=Faecalibaculum rodentium TaxID=1702221 RepID=UPI001F572D81|nr:helix-turn-helix transcriptional regulator [Faecalibaculum rodentium]
MAVGERIKERRKALGMSAEQLGKIIGRNRATIYRYEKGDIEELPYTIMIPLSKALRTTPEYLLGIETDEIEPDVDPQWGDDAANIEYLQKDPKLLDQYIQLTRKNDTIGLLFDKVKDLSPKDVEKVLKIVELIDQENE